MEKDDTIIYGLHAVSAALEQAVPLITLWLDQGRRDARMESLVDLANAGGVACQWTSRAELTRLAGTDKHQGVVARCQPERHYGESHLETLLEGVDTPFILVLDGVQDPHNLGACLRSADGAGVHLVIVPRDNAAGITPVVRKVAAGATESVPLVRVTNLARTLRKLKDQGIWLVGTAGESQTPIYNQDLSGPLALVMGGEGKGLRRLTRELCDFLVSLPMHGRVESLNVSVATGICLYEALRQRD